MKTIMHNIVLPACRVIIDVVFVFYSMVLMLLPSKIREWLGIEDSLKLFWGELTSFTKEGETDE